MSFSADKSSQADPAQSGESVAGIIERVTFHNGETGFCVLKVRARGHRDEVTVVGVLPEVRAGEWMQAQGQWFIDKQYGRQFKAQMMRTTPPNTAEGIERYLASGLIKGIGPVLAQRLVRAFGVRVFEIIDLDPHNLRHVEGIGAHRQEVIVAAWKQQKVVRDIMVFLHSHGVSTNRAFRIYKTYGDGAISQVTEDPYRLARDVHGIGFRTADQIAASVGIAKDSPLRARAGVEYVLQQLTEQGHCGYGTAELIEMASQMLEIDQPLVEDAVRYLTAAKRVVARTLDDDAASPAVFLAKLDAAEENLARALAARAGGQHPCPDINVEKAIAWVEARTKLELAPQQRQAIRLACQSRLLVITGGPGVGKTTIINSIVQIMRAKKMDVVLAAPTGRAAKRMSEATHAPAKTIHRLLAFDPAEGGFKHDADRPLGGDVFIIDEASMLDVTLAWSLVRAIPPHAAVILVGDVDQLPSVGPGCVLRDVIDSSVAPVCRLTEVFRQAAASAIITNAHRINHGQMPVFPTGKVDSPQSCDFYFVEEADPDKAVALLSRLVCADIPAKFGLDRMDDVQVLSPMQKGTLGCQNLNAVLQQALNPTGPAVERYGWTFRAGDKVMQMVNDYDKDVFNGDIGRIDSIDEGEQEVTIRFDDRMVKYDYGELDELALSYATTVHKSQGSEYPAVVIPVHTQHYVMLQRNLLYTGVTRGRRLVILLGTAKAIGIAISRAEARRRVTLLKRRLISPTPMPAPLFDDKAK